MDFANPPKTIGTEVFTLLIPAESFMAIGQGVLELLCGNHPIHKIWTPKKTKPCVATIFYIAELPKTIGSEV